MCGRDAERTSRRSASPASSAGAAVTEMSPAATPGTSAVIRYPLSVSTTSGSNESSRASLASSEILARFSMW